MARHKRDGDYVSQEEAARASMAITSFLFKLGKWIAIGCFFLVMFTVLLIPIGIPYLLFKYNKTKAGIIYIIVMLFLGVIGILLEKAGLVIL